MDGHAAPFVEVTQSRFIKSWNTVLLSLIRIQGQMIVSRAKDVPAFGKGAGEGCAMASLRLMESGCGMDAVDATDHIVLLVFIKQHAAIEAKAIHGGANFHGQVTPAGNTFPLDVEGGFTGVCFKKRRQIVNIQH
jgi:hypothetical protein